MAFIPAARRTRDTTGPVGSAFSKGDVLVYNSNSSLSLAQGVTGILLAGVALADSTEALDGQVPYSVLYPGERYWASVATTPTAAGTRMTLNATADGLIRLATTGHVIVDSVVPLDDGSNSSRVLVQFDPDLLVYGTGG